MPQQTSPQFEQFQSVLRNLFMLDHAELDFGIYRIMNQKRKDIDAWLSDRLRQKVQLVLGQKQSETATAKQIELQKTIEAAKEAGFDPENSPKVKQLREELDTIGCPEEFENMVYSHLSTFFSRYYDDGDFISKRRYKENIYAIPYEGDEVKLHWANADQYYIKTAEYFRNYAFHLSEGKTVEFVLRETATEQNNNKAQGDQQRRFALYMPISKSEAETKDKTNTETDPKTENETENEGKTVEVDGDKLRIFFTYQLYPKTTRQKDLAQQAHETLKSLVPTEFYELFAPRPTENDKDRTLLQKHITDYVARNQFDYFIHKDLRNFLNRELDFYVKNEMLFIDDIDRKESKQFIALLDVVKAVKTIGREIIGFLASIEDFQKRLWEKRKFITQADYCITLDHIAPEFYADIIANDLQRNEWVRLFAIDKIAGDAFNDAYSEPLTEKFLTENQFLPLDTALFTPDFKHRLLATIDDLDNKTNGLLINSENFQALRLLQEEYTGQVKCIYIDPPYNTGSDGFTYKDGYQHSTWLAMMRDRLSLAKQRLSDDGVIFISIDDNEQARLKILCDEVFGEENFVGNVIWQRTYAPISLKKFYSESHDYCLTYAKKIDNLKFNLLPRGEKQNKDYKNPDNDPRGVWKVGNLTVGPAVQKQIYEIVGPTGRKFLPPSGYCWRFTKEKFKQMCADKRIWFGADGSNSPVPKLFLSEVQDGITPMTLWTFEEAGHNQEATREFRDLMSASVFTSPKPLRYIKRFLYIGSDSETTVLDFFAGSGTTGHAVINLNRVGGNRKYILVEMGDYFDTVTKPRVLKAAYSKEWKEGAPVGRNGVSQIVKCVRLEQYEDTLNNLVAQRPGEILTDRFEETRLLGYLLDTETRDSLFNLTWFDNPFDVRLKITQGNETRERQIDLVETFNYLIGLQVESFAWPKDGLCTVTGLTRHDEKTLVIWRDVNRVDNAVLNDFFAQSTYATPDKGFEVIYVNGDNRLESVRQEVDRWKVRLTEETFQKKMFEEA